MSYFVGGWSLVLIGLCESMLIGWVYGAKRLMADIEDMVGFKLWKHWWFCWTFITPLLLIVSTRVLVVLLDLHHTTASHRKYTRTLVVLLDLHHATASHRKYTSTLVVLPSLLLMIQS